MSCDVNVQSLINGSACEKWGITEGYIFIPLGSKLIRHVPPSRSLARPHSPTITAYEQGIASTGRYLDWSYDLDNCSFHPSISPGQ